MHTQPDGCSYPLDDTDVPPHDDTHDQCWQEIESISARLAAAEARVAELKGLLREAVAGIDDYWSSGKGEGSTWVARTTAALRGEEVRG